MSSLCWHMERGPTSQKLATSKAVWSEFDVLKENWVPATAAAVAIMTSHFSSLSPSVQWDWRSGSPCKCALEKQNKITMKVILENTNKSWSVGCAEKGIQWQLRETKERDGNACLKSWRDLCWVCNSKRSVHYHWGISRQAQPCSASVKKQEG